MTTLLSATDVANITRLLPEPEMVTKKKPPSGTQRNTMTKTNHVSMGYLVHNNYLLLNNWGLLPLALACTKTELNTCSGKKGNISTPWRRFPVWIVQTLYTPESMFMILSWFRYNVTKCGILWQLTRGKVKVSWPLLMDYTASWLKISEIVGKNLSCLKKGYVVCNK